MGESGFKIALLMCLALIAGRTPFVWADPCSAHNLETEPGNPMQKIPVYDQDGSGICYAYSASELMNAYLLSKDPKAGLQVHPALAAIRVSTEGLDNGGMAHAIGACREGDGYSYASIQAALERIGSNADMSEAQVLHFIEKLGKLMNDPTIGGKIPPGLPKWVTTVLQPLVRKAAYSRLETDAFCSADEKKGLEGFALSAPVSNAAGIAAHSLLDPAARTKPPAVPAPAFFQLRAEDEDQIKQLVRRHFDGPDGKLPMGIGFCSRVLYSPTAREITRSRDSKGLPQGALSKNCANHAAILVGTRPSGNSCEYLLRNSWGTGFSQANPHSCICRNSRTGSYQECPGTGLEPKTVESNGITMNILAKVEDHAFLKVISCWIPEDDLAPNIFSATVLRDK